MKKLFALAILLVLVMAAVGCTKMTGGGWIPVDDGKATFGFNLQCDPDTGEVKGNLNFNDHVNNVKFKADAVAVTGTCTGGEYFGAYHGKYIPKPARLGDGGQFAVVLFDEGEPGATAGDFFRVTLSGGYYDGYTVEGNLGGGNIQGHEVAD